MRVGRGGMPSSAGARLKGLAGDEVFDDKLIYLPKRRDGNSKLYERTTDAQEVLYNTAVLPETLILG